MWMYMLQYTVPHLNAIQSVSRYQNTLYVYCIQLIYTHTKGHTWPCRQCSHTSHSTQSYRHTSHSIGHFTKITQAILTFQFKTLSDAWTVHSCATCLLKCISQSVLNLYKVYQHVLLQGVCHTEKQNCDLNVIVQNWFGKPPCQCSSLMVIV